MPSPDPNHVNTTAPEAEMALQMPTCDEEKKAWNWEPPWDPSTNEYSARETRMLDHQGQISIPATAAREPVFVNTVVSYSLAYDAADVVDNDNLATELESQIQISIVLIGMVRKPSIEPIALAK